MKKTDADSESKSAPSSGNAIEGEDSTQKGGAEEDGSATEGESTAQIGAGAEGESPQEKGSPADGGSPAEKGVAQEESVPDREKAVEDDGAEAKGGIPDGEGGVEDEGGVERDGGPEGEDAAEGESDVDVGRSSAMQWYVVHTYSGHENKVKANLERAINSAGLTEKFGQILVATEDYAEMKNGKRTITKKKTFPSYVLVEMEMGNEARHLVTNIPGVTGFVGTGREPVPLREDEIRRVLGLDAEGKVAKVAPSVPFKVGEHVRVIDGPFSDFTGVVDEINPERGKVKVMVSIFGRATPVELDFLQVQTI